MLHETIELRPDYARAGIPVPNTANARMKTYIIDSPFDNAPLPPRPAVVIFTGGGYRITSPHATEPFALAYNAEGFHAFVVYYSVTSTQPDVRYPGSLLEAFMAIATIRDHAKEWHVDPQKIITCGTSAGGHLAACTGVLWNQPEFSDLLGRAPREYKPNGMVLCYPVISGGEFAHEDSFCQLLGNRLDELREALSLELRVNEDTVPTFLWHTYTDKCVPVENSLYFACALKKYNIPLEMHIFPYGDHGLSLATEAVGGGPEEVRAWFPMAVRWIRNV